MAVAEVESAPVRARPLPRAGASTTSPVVFLLFILSLLTPVVLHFGTFAMAPSRLFVLIMFFPSVYLWISGRAGQLRAFDFVMLFCAFWAVMSLMLNHGLSSYQRAGFIFLEMVGSYMFARAFVRSAEDFRSYMKYVMLGLVLMMPFGILETQTGDPIIITTLQSFVDTEPVIDHEVRLGLERAQVVFPHPILYGMFCAAMLGVVVRGANYGSGAFSSAWRILLVGVNTICSVSSGAWMCFIAQTALLMYDRIFRTVSRRWLILVILVVLLYVAIDLAANSSPAKVFVRYFTLNPASGRYRILQFDVAMLNIAMDPLIGRGFQPLIKPRWMVPSLDNYWLVLAVRYGAVMFFAFLGGILFMMYQVGKARLSDPLTREIRAGFLISLAGFLVAVTSVHVWSNLNIWFMFFLGAGMWLLDAPKEAGKEVAGIPTAGRLAAEGRRGARDLAEGPEATDGDEAAAPTPVGRYSRFPVKPRASEARRNGRGTRR